MLGQAWGLLFCWLVKALLLDPDSEAPGCELGVFLERFRIVRGKRLHLGQVGVQPQSIPAGLLKILSRPDKGAWAVVDSFTQSVEVAGGLWSEKDQCLLSFCGNDNENALFANRFVPRFDALEPLRRRGIGSSAKKSHDQNIVRGLALRQVGMNPEPIAGEKIGNFGDGEGFSLALNMHIDLWAKQIKGRGVRVTSVGRHKKQDQRRQQNQ